MTTEGSESRVTLHLVREGEGLWRDAERFQYRHYVDLGFAEVHADEVVPTYQAWNDQAVFHVACHHGAVVGVIRTITGSTASTLPVGHTWQLDDALESDRLVEFASLVVNPGLRGALVAEALYGSAFRWSVEHGLESIVAVVDEWLFEMLRDGYGVPFAAIGEPREYMGGSPLPIAVDIADVVRAVPEANPRFWRVLSEGLDPKQIAAASLAVTAQTPR